MDKLSIKLFETKEDCCGCAACYAICPREAIVLKMDKEGFEYPEIIESLCVACKLCIKVCPIKKADLEI